MTHFLPDYHIHHRRNPLGSILISFAILSLTSIGLIVAWLSLLLNLPIK